jgi:NAD(P)-dependent dehydrogenase (short-subunit alcohol dehydrogenase family)
MHLGPAYDFRDKVVLVTGVNRVGQIGHAVALAFGQAGAKLVVCDINTVGVATRAKEFQAAGIPAKAAAGDLTEPDVARWCVQQALQTYGRLDVVINAAGGLTAVGPMVDADTSVLDREFDVNLKTTYLVSVAAAKVMVSQRQGAIVNFASVAALLARPQMAAYSAAKAAVAALTRSLALELRDHGIRVNAVAPGLARTADNLEARGDDTEARWVQVAEIVNAVMFLASDLASGITGHVLPVAHGEV